MWSNKSCPRCRGDLFVDDAVGESYIKCLQCGYEKEIARGSSGEKSRSTKKERPGIIPVTG